MLVVICSSLFPVTASTMSNVLNPHSQIKIPSIPQDQCARKNSDVDILNPKCDGISRWAFKKYEEQKGGPSKNKISTPNKGFSWHQPLTPCEGIRSKHRGSWS